MIPIYVASQSGDVRPLKNPIYFIRKAMGRQPQGMASITVLNTENRMDAFPDVATNYLPVGYTYRPAQDAAAWYDIETASVQSMWDANVEPNADRDNSIASEPRNVQAIVSLRGFVRGADFPSLMNGIDFINYTFDPVINFLEGASTFDHTLAPQSQPFNNVGFGVLAWYDGKEGIEMEPPYYEKLNRFIYVRSVSKPVSLSTKFDDMQASFNIQLLAIDSRIYEFIGTPDFNQTVPTVNGEELNHEGDGPTITSTETIIKPSRLWAGTDMTGTHGPGYREETATLGGGGG